MFEVGNFLARDFPLDLVLVSWLWDCYLQLVYLVPVALKVEEGNTLARCCLPVFLSLSLSLSLSSAN